MTSAQTFTGIGDRSSSRVLAPPGGGQSFNIFGGGNDAPTHTITGRKIRQPEPQQQQQQQQQPQYSQNQYQSSSASAYGRPADSYQQQQQQPRRAEPAPQQQADYNGNGGSGLHQGRSSTRLHAPPGGQSSMGSILGGGSDNNTAPSRSGRRDPNASSQSGGLFGNQTNQTGGRAAAPQQSRGHGNIISWQ